MDAEHVAALGHFFRRPVPHLGVSGGVGFEHAPDGGAGALRLASGDGLGEVGAWLLPAAPGSPVPPILGFCSTIGLLMLLFIGGLELRQACLESLCRERRDLLEAG